MQIHPFFFLCPHVREINQTNHSEILIMNDKSQGCDNNCGSCGEDCSSRTDSTQQAKAGAHSGFEKQHEMSNVKKVFGVLSGKGGVGKSLVTSLLASKFNKNCKAAVLDADITGPSIPKMFGVNARADGNEFGLFPQKTKNGLPIMSVNLLLEHDTDPIIWRGPKLSSIVKQFWSDVLWDEVDYMFVDMPPGTGDVALTVFQSIPLDGLIIVTSPQDLVSMIVAKAVKMANMLNVPIVGMIENMSYLECPDCGKKIEVFGKSGIEKASREYNIPVLDRIPINPKLAEACDKGDIESLADDFLNEAQDKIINAEGRFGKKGGCAGYVPKNGAGKH